PRDLRHPKPKPRVVTLVASFFLGLGPAGDLMRAISTVLGTKGLGTGLAASLLLALSAPAGAQTRIPEQAVDTATQLRETALASDLGYRITESLTTEVGPRLAGSEA